MVTVRGAIPEMGVTPRRATLIWWTAATVVVGTLLVPLFSTDIPPLLDYPNHLARMWIVNFGAADPSLSRMYAVEWGIQPNIGLDMVVPALARFMPLDLAGKVFIALAVVLPVSGAIALHRALFRHRSYWPLAAGLLGYNGMLFAGFVNFLVGAGLALWAAALWEAQRESARLPRLLAASLAAIVIFFCHIIAVGLFGVLLAGIELARPGRLGVRLRRLLWLAIPFAVPLILFLGAPLREAVPSAHGGILVALKQLYWAIVAGPLRMKLLGVASPFLTYSWLLDAIAAALLTAALGAWIAHRRMQWAPGALIVAVGLMAAYPFVPLVLMGASWIDQRLPIFAALMLFAAGSPTTLPRRQAIFWCAAFAAVFFLRIATVAGVWSGHNADLADFRQVISTVPAGSRVLVTRSDDGTDPDVLAGEPPSRRFMLSIDAMNHLPALIVIERKAFIPYLFSDPRKQPLRVLPPYDRLAIADGAPPFASALDAPTARDLQFAPYLATWRQDFDWVLLLRPHKVPGSERLLPDTLEMMAIRDIAALYRIRKAG